MNRTRWMLLCLILLTVAVYWPVYHYGFIDYDDTEYVSQNVHVLAGFSSANLKYAFTTYMMGNWNPLLLISFYTDRWMFGLNPGAMHVENVLMHLIAGLLLWRLLLVCTGKTDLSFIAAAIFLIHPMHVESVVWISERKDVLSTPLLIGAMLAYVNYQKWSDGFFDSPGQQARAIHKKNRRATLSYLLMVLLFTLSLMAKSMGVTLTGILLLMDFWPLRRWPGRSWIYLILDKIPLVAISLAFAWVASQSQKTTGAVTSFNALGLVDRIDNAIVCYVMYIVKLLVPVGLAVFYQHPGARPLAPVIAAAGLLVMITLFCAWQRKQRPWLIVGWCWFLGTLVPVIGLVQIGGQAMADRYSYLSSIGLSVAVIWGISEAVKNSTARVILAVSVVIVFTGLAARQVFFWRSSEALFQHAVDVTDDNPIAHVVLAHVAFEKHDIKGTIDQCNLALRYRDNARAYDGLGNCWLLSADDADHFKAIGYFRKAISLDPYAVEFRISLASALRLTGQLDLARQEAQTAYTMHPENPAVTKELAAIDAAERSPQPR